MIKIIFLLKWQSLKSQLQYPVNFIIQVLGVSLTDFGVVAGFLVLTHAFHLIGGWTFWEVAFMNSIFQLSHGLFLIFFLSFWGHGWRVRNGDFDRLLIRPLHPILQIMADGFPLAALGELLPGVIMLWITSSRVEVTWSPATITFLGVVILSGTMIEWAVYLFRAGFDFWFAEASNLSYVFNFFIFYTPRYPAHIYGKALLLFLTFIFPSAFIAFYPTHYFFGLPTFLPIPFLVYLSPIVALVALTIAILFWSVGLRHYESSGT